MTVNKVVDRQKVVIGGNKIEQIDRDFRSVAVAARPYFPSHFFSPLRDLKTGKIAFWIYNIQYMILKSLLIRRYCKKLCTSRAFTSPHLQMYQDQLCHCLDTDK